MADTPPRGPGRPRSTATPEAIRGAAAKLFAEHGFGGTSVRDIASVAGSDPAVVIRHFGSKEKLFLEVLTLPQHFQGLVEGPRDSLGREILRKLIEADDSTLRLYKALLGALDRTDVRHYLKQSTSQHMIDPLAKRLAGPNRRLRRSSWRPRSRACSPTSVCSSRLQLSSVAAQRSTTMPSPSKRSSTRQHSARRRHRNG